MELHEIQSRLGDAIGELEAEFVRTIQELVRIPSVVGNEAEAQNFMEELYRMAGLEVARFEAHRRKIEKHPGFIDTGVSYENRPNIIGTFPGNPNGPSIILNGHIDVVSPEPIQAWTRDPWGGQIEGDRLYGRGAGDMKSGLLANLFALKSLVRAGFKPKGTVMLHSVVDEEAGGAGGTLACLMEGYTADGMICTEPHNLNITISHGGINYFRVRVQGQTAHAGLAHLGVNAIGKIYPIYQALVDLDQKRGREISFPLFEKGSGRSCHLNIGTMHAGDWPSTVAGSAVVECRVGFVPGERMGDIKALIENTIMEAAQEDPWLRDHPPQVEWFGWSTDPWYQDPEHPFVQTLKKAANDILGREAEFIGRASGNDGRFSQYFGMAGACIGAKAANIHGIDEYVETSSVIQIVHILAMTVLQWCGFES